MTVSNHVYQWLELPSNAAGKWLVKTRPNGILLPALEQPSLNNK